MDMLAGNESSAYCRKPDIMADAAYVILTSDPKKVTGMFYIDDEILSSAGVTDFDNYACVPANKDKLMPDFFLDVKPTSDTAPVTKEIDNNKQKAEAPSGKVAGIFFKMEQHLNKDLVQNTQCVYQFNVSGEEAGVW